MFDAKKISEAIRMKKKAAMKAEPELVHTDAKADMNPTDLYNVTNQARMEETMDTPKKIDADETSMNESYQGIGIAPDQKMRMERLRKYIDSLDM